MINGHNHSYERTHALRSGQVIQALPQNGSFDPIDPIQHGTVYVTAGAGGQAAYPSTLYPASYFTAPDGTRMPETADWSAVRYLGDHSRLVVDVAPRSGDEPAHMDVVAIAKSDGHEVDRFRVVRTNTAIVPAIVPGHALPLAVLLAAAGNRALRARAGRSSVGAGQQQDQTDVHERQPEIVVAEGASHVAPGLHPDSADRFAQWSRGLSAKWHSGDARHRESLAYRASTGARISAASKK